MEAEDGREGGDWLVASVVSASEQNKYHTILDHWMAFCLRHFSLNDS